MEECAFSADVENAPPIAAFAYTSVGPHGVVELSGLPSRDDDTPNGPSPFVPGIGFITNFSVVVNDPNNIVAYAWDLDQDGAPDAFGERLVASLEVDVAHPITLTVWDHQGATAQVTQLVTPRRRSYDDIIVDGDLAIDEFVGGSMTSSGGNAGWYADRATLVNETARLDGQYGFAWIGQVMYDQRTRRGLQELTFDYALYEGLTNPNNGQQSRLRVRLWGINGEFDASYQEYPQPAGAIPYDEALLYDELFETPTDWVQRAQTIDVGDDGFDYYVVSFHGTGVFNSTRTMKRASTTSRSSGVMGRRHPADLTGDGVVSVADLMTMLECMEADTPDCVGADLMPDGVLDGQDIVAMLGALGVAY